MINKQNMWFLTLFAIILVLSIYYVTLSDDSLTKILDESNSTSVISTTDDEATVVESVDELEAQRVSRETESEEDYLALQTILLSDESTIEEKNDAFDSIQQLNISKSKEEKLEKIIKKEFDLNSVIKIDENKIYVIVSSNEGTKELANSIINKIQESFDSERYITVNFQSTSN